MKKMSLLVLALIVSLPGCGKKQESSRPVVRKNTIEKYVQVDGEVELMDDIDDLDEDEEENVDAGNGRLKYVNLVTVI